ncbi:MAG: hypothetical protein L6R38_001937 [Xanthoria sp. 2 TBL-2021]|nr:MAG: hypothetical protein L6R38_001937 [Xanthoria sp. 2 TBL-2021]
MCALCAEMLLESVESATIAHFARLKGGHWMPKDDKIRDDGHTRNSEYRSLSIDTLRFDERVPCATDWLAGEDHGKDDGNREGDDKDSHTPDNGMELAVGKYSTVQKKNGYLGRSERDKVKNDTGIDCLAFCKQEGSMGRRLETCTLA